MDELNVIDLPDDIEAPRVSCKDSVLTVFPDICPNHLDDLASQYGHDPDSIIWAILDQQENGQKYPTRYSDNPLKRKRGVNDDISDVDSGDEAANPKEPQAASTVRSQIAKPEYTPNFSSKRYREMAKFLLCQDFPRAPTRSVWSILLAKRSLFDAYAHMDEVTRNWDNQNPPWQPKKAPTKSMNAYTPENFSSFDYSSYPAEEKAALDELRAARELRAHKDAKTVAEAEEQANFVRAQLSGQTAECGCCYDEQALNRMAQCDGEMVHFFCGSCLKRQAETQVGYSKYELKCMSMDGCSGGFSYTQRKRFLDKALRTALDRIEQEAVLREAGIESLETCPFCSYAAEYPPVDEDKEFRCEMPGCRRVSCRLCRKETHIPKSCAEAAREEGLTARREIEEAMSEALIRKCNKCRNPFVKEDGCNKITCTRCRTIQCYICRETVKDYSHFNDTSRGGKSGQCPLFDSTEQRHRDEVQRAEEAARQKVTQERPDVGKTLASSREQIGFRQPEESCAALLYKQLCNGTNNRPGLPPHQLRCPIAESQGGSLLGQPRTLHVLAPSPVIPLPYAERHPPAAGPALPRFLADPPAVPAGLFAGGQVHQPIRDRNLGWPIMFDLNAAMLEELLQADDQEQLHWDPSDFMGDPVLAPPLIPAVAARNHRSPNQGANSPQGQAPAAS
ncbi:hypothetical protein DL766_003486 [Monosporascus sp. MC13-8B]|uniref:RING-type domain-containing protein n=1 Tax=Monosporascus cannonballus TaxID=155416 RepID=A0ABY0HKA1_9PEZI|nr:hypothetical protein DL762_000025 [Monosporascus cannonballus]RYP00708.1 hypothetical protein DL763_000588 [Monosporascus cannonballus]RYP33355.1 hypothetical protein DL766_003486 [Monosporascus sp. MC13-8B]